ncbi:DUF4292 domain-containing protein [Acidipila sp. EB88]|uniref:DUF4292 domain-containing protein n=1 Tax=Acidipila sp. EB88 TaxID=2305226 RepID=UPI000F5FFECC|nr:DUF4292 domain-containing protein [Acidipila sp. EB88]RRA48292.1 DUF4292 domain-containing protein [Acidipila sp. EB88]
MLLGLLLPALTGCLVHTHSVQQPRMPAIVMSAAADELVERINDNSHKVQTLKASVGFQVSVGGARKGKVTDYTTLSGYLLLQQPEQLRVLGLLPVVHSPAFDLASDGKNFTLVVPPRSRAYTGANAITRPSPNTLENLRPNIFYDTLLIREIDPKDLVERTMETTTRVDPVTHVLLGVPEYALTVGRRKEGSQEMIRERVIHFDRTTLLPSGVDTYDDTGTLQTQAVYGEYATFGDQRFPATITIRRPVDEYQIVLSIQKLTLNQPLPDTQFTLTIPDGYTIKKLD